MNDLAISCDEVTELYDKETKTVPVHINGKKAIFKTQNCILLVFLLIAI